VPISYAGDLARLVLEALRRYSSPTPLILAPDAEDEVSIADVARAIGTSLRFVGAPTFDAAQPDGQLRKTACNGRLRATLLAEDEKEKGKGRFDFRFTPLAEGLAATAAWFEANYETARK
jgi:GDP-L-fucose synthase